MVTGSGQSAVCLARLRPLSACTSGSFSGTRDRLTVFLTGETSLNLLLRPSPNEKPVRSLTNKRAGADADPQRDGRSADLRALAERRGSGRSEGRRFA